MSTEPTLDFSDRTGQGELAMSVENRRPIKARSLGFIQRFAAWLARTAVTPNQISTLSMVCAGLVPAAFLLWDAGTWAAALTALVGIQLRLLCNLLDGMVAIEGGRKSLLGGIYNEFPDRIADTTILIGAALVAVDDARLMVLALSAALLAMMTAYTRVLGASLGAMQCFAGPMAKQHRMALLTMAFVALPLLPARFSVAQLMGLILLTICIGCVVTVANRLRLIALDLGAQDPK